MVISISPVLVSIGPLAVRWFGLLVLVGIGAGVWLTLRQTTSLGVRRAVVLDALAWAIPTGVIFARAVNVVGWWDYYFMHAQDILQLNLEDGLSLWGGLIGGGLVAMARLGARRRRVLDAAAPGLALAIAIGRVGEFLDGHGLGTATSLAFGVSYTNHQSAAIDFGVLRHPVQIYDAIVCVVLFALMTRLPALRNMAVFVVTYGASRIALGGLRLDPAFLFGVQLEQLLAGVCVVGALAALARTPRLRTVRSPVQHRDRVAA